jgi:hypothetical protein
MLFDKGGPGQAPHENEWRPPSGSRGGGGGGGGGGGTGAGKHFKQLDNLRMLVEGREEKERKERQEYERQQQRQRQTQIEQQQQQQQQQATKQQQEQQQQAQAVLAKAASKKSASSTAVASASASTSLYEAKLKSSDMVAEAMRWRQHSAELQAQVETVQTKFRKMANKVKVQVNHLAGTITSLHVALKGSQQGGNGSSQGVQTVLEMVQAKDATFVPGFMQVIANRIVQVAAQGTAPDVIKVWLKLLPAI